MESFRTNGTCSRQILYNVGEDEVVTELRFIGGCGGNLQGISRLVVGKRIDDVVPLLKGIRCKNGTSCPDQLTLALNDYKAKKAQSV